VKLQSPKHFLLHAISQYWNNWINEYVFGYNLCFKEASFIMLRYVGILIMQYNAINKDNFKIPHTVWLL